jgi:hypothetical protein
MLIVERNEGALEMAGFIPGFLNEDDPRKAKEQINTAYAHGGGWNKFDGFAFDPQSLEIKYEGDPALKPYLAITLRDELILVYPHAWTLILQRDNSYEIARLD